MQNIPLQRVPTLLISLILAYGSFSRFTHGDYTPTMYRYQINRAPDDGTFGTAVIPVVDGLLAAFLLAPSERANVIAAGAICVSTSMGVVMRVLEMGVFEAGWDAALAALAVLALWEALMRSKG